MRWSAATAFRLLVLSLALSALACAGPPPRPRAVGLRFRPYVDEARRDWSDTRSRPLATAVWYPAAHGAHERPWSVSIFNAGWSAQDAPLATDAGDRLPLVVISHGTGGGAATLSWLAEALATNGYVVAAVHQRVAAKHSPSSTARSAGRSDIQVRACGIATDHRNRGGTIRVSGAAPDLRWDLPLVSCISDRYV